MPPSCGAPALAESKAQHSARRGGVLHFNSDVVVKRLHAYVKARNAAPPSLLQLPWHCPARAPRNTTPGSQTRAGWPLRLHKPMQPRGVRAEAPGVSCGLLVCRAVRFVPLQGVSVDELAAAAGVKRERVLEALVEGLKAGVLLDEARLMQDFKLGEGGPGRERAGRGGCGGVHSEGASGRCGHAAKKACLDV
jgi:hypothetical protein